MDGAAGERDNRPMFDVCFATAPDELELARSLFREYAGEVDAPCCFATFDAEVASLPGDYAPPAGRLFLARRNGEAAGCVAMRRHDAASGEMKRLYVRQAFRRDRLGRTLAKLVITAAREQRYRRVLLDTLPKMHEAAALYRSLGFVERGPYSDTPTPGAIFFELSLS
ncbi:MAG TPA: GNAT family N-acetyltransferase [Burkholderiales bacterium]|nr:GNAT family N-acetyltransferase [Burkholderiales bacterium]